MINAKIIKYQCMLSFKKATKIRYILLTFPLWGLGGFLPLWGQGGFEGIFTVAQWNGYTQASPPADGKFKATDGVVANRRIAVLTRDATVANSNYAVNTDGVAASSGWHNATDTDTEKFWIATFVTTGYENLTLTSKQMGSNAGPADFKIQYQVASEEWTDLPNGVITVGGSNYASGTVTDLELPATMFDRPSVSLRWLCTSTTRISGDNLVASTGVNRLDVTVNGTAKSGVVDPRIVVSTNELRFNVQAQTRSFTVTGENLTAPISITSSAPSLFLPGVFSLPAGATDAAVNIMFAGAVNATGTITLSSGAAFETVNLLAVVSGTENDGSIANPYTIAEAQKNQGSSNYYWVKGYIIGTVKTGNTSYDPVFEAPFSQTNILIADDPLEVDKMKIIPVELPAEGTAPGVRAGVNLQQNSDNFGQLIKAEGTLAAYFSMPGIRNTRAYTFNISGIDAYNASALTVFAENGVLYIKNLKETENINIYDLTGRLIIRTAATEIPLPKGIYVVSPLTPEGGILVGIY